MRRNRDFFTFVFLVCNLEAALAGPAGAISAAIGKGIVGDNQFDAALVVTLVPFIAGPIAAIAVLGGVCGDVLRACGHDENAADQHRQQQAL